nr:hypothetical protein GCM10020093_109750 [Planobispora longispora]
MRDVARRHGEVTVTTVACIVQASDPVLLAEIAGHRRLGRLGLRLLAPTVLASAMPADKTLAALRESGYAPVPIEDTGEITVRRTRIEEPQGGRLILLPGGQVAELDPPAHVLVEPRRTRTSTPGGCSSPRAGPPSPSRAPGRSSAGWPPACPPPSSPCSASWSTAASGRRSRWPTA